MIELIDDLPGPVVGFRAKGKVTGDDDTKILMPRVDAALTTHDKVRLLYVLDDDELDDAWEWITEGLAG